MNWRKAGRAVLRRWRWVIGFLLIVALLISARHFPIGEWLDSVADPLRRQGWLGVALYALGYFVAAMFCLPCMPLTLAGGYIFGTVKGVVAVHTGVMLAAAGGFLVGRYLGRKRAAQWMRQSQRFHTIDEAIAEEGWKIVGLLRMHAIPFGISNYLYGMTAIEFWHYFIASFVAMLPGHFIYVHIGSLGGRHLAGEGEIGVLSIVIPVLGIVSMIAMTIVFTRIVRKHKRRHRERQRAHA
jgi:uncharacterized membrane protein YdjX (TVP38/TMEM64 family)